MAVEKINAVSVPSERDAYEAEQYLLGLPFINDVSCDSINNTIEIDYNSNVSREEVLDQVEKAGLKPDSRSTMFDKIKRRLTT